MEKNPRGGGDVLYCDGCGGREFDADDDGFFYCRQCGCQNQEMVVTGCADEDIHGEAAPYSIFRHRARPHSDGAAHRDQILRPYEPRDFGARQCPDAETVVGGIRLRYVLGMQVMGQLQCESLVERFGVSPLICGIVSDIWLRYVALSRVFDDKWVEKVIAESKSNSNSRDGQPERQKPSEQTKDNSKMATSTCLRSLRKSIPVYSSLAIAFLCCHVAREAVLPTDICQWALEGKLPYLAAFVEIDKRLGASSDACPLSSMTLFRPVRAVDAWNLEATAASIAEKVGLRLPSVNFYAIACRFIKELALPLEKIVPHALRIYEWSIPAELWLSCNASRFPTRVSVMSMLIVTIRILYDIHGQGIWEMALSDHGGSPSRHNAVDLCPEEPSSSSAPKPGKIGEKSSTSKKLNHNKDIEFNTKELLGILEAAYDKISNPHDYSKDLMSYLRYCKDIIFAGITTSYDEEILMEKLWDIYEKPEVDNLQENQKDEFHGLKGKRPMDKVPSTGLFYSKKPREEGESSLGRSMNTPIDSKLKGRNEFLGDNSGLSGKQSVYNSSSMSSKDASVEKLKVNMEENGFQYLPSRVRPKSDGYLHYNRKRIDGKLILAAHADYYILLRVCARVAQVDVRIMHMSVLQFERRLAWIEKQIESSLKSLAEKWKL